MIVKGMIYGSSYSGCTGWDSWVIREIRFRCKPERVKAAMKRAENRVAKTAPTYNRRGIDWKTPILVDF